jgi:hypothetical protein
VPTAVATKEMVIKETDMFLHFDIDSKIVFLIYFKNINFIFVDMITIKRFSS